MTDIFLKIAEERKNNVPFIICIVVRTGGSAPRDPGAKMLVYPDGRICGTIGGGRIEKTVIDDALVAMKTGAPVLLQYDLLKQLGMSCGGSMDIYIEPVMSKNKLYIFGAGHTGIALAKIAVAFDFDITVIDDRKEYINDLVISGISKLNGSFNEVLPTLLVDNNTYIAIMTYSHECDRQILSYFINKHWAYLGMMGSLRKVALTKKMLLQEGFASSKELENVDMPMGIEIGADGPEEIAISLMAKLLSVKNKTGLK